MEPRVRSGGDAPCGGLNEYGPHRLVDLDVGSSGSGTI